VRTRGLGEGFSIASTVAHPEEHEVTGDAAGLSGAPYPRAFTVSGVSAAPQLRDHGALQQRVRN
jgi:hypothetical protein